LHPIEAPKTPRVTTLLAGAHGPIVAVTDFMKIVPEQIARFVPGGPTRLHVLGTDGYGRSDTRAALRRHFETDAANIVVATLHALELEGVIAGDDVAKAIARFGIDTEAPDPRTA
jgi:pyruvate dehydrogenase E1 component